MQIQQNVSLKRLNTFGIDVQASKFVSVHNEKDLIELFDSELVGKSFFVLGGGSNILFKKDFDGLVIKNEILGISLVSQDKESIFVKSGAGEVWHNLVLWAVNKGLGGLENLSLIPGSVGASPIQNIGAYGVELKDVFHSLEAFDIHTKKIISFTKEECQFDYRNSIFKNELKNKVIIVSVTLQLSKYPVANIEYGSLKEYMVQNNVRKIDIKSISDAVCAIRRSKLPNPSELGNAGSFFKNPVIDRSKFNALKEKYTEMVGYPISGNEIKVAAGWLIESCGWKGKRVGDTGSHAKQALVLVNYGNATGKEIFNLSEDIIASVKEKYDINLEREVNIL